jgi:glycosyltransferase involved in cell wall biosynthesis
MHTIVFSSNSSWYLFNFKIETLKNLVDLGYNVVCISPQDKHSSKLQDIGCIHENIEFQSKSRNPLKDLKIFFNYLFLYRRLKPMICFHFTVKPNIYATLAAAILRIKIINNITGLGTTFIHKNFVSTIVKFLYVISQPLAYKIFCQNEDDLAILSKLGSIKKDKLLLVPGSGVNIKKFSPIEKHYKKDHIYTFIYIGRMLSDKGLRELISAIKILNKNQIICKLLLYGPFDSDNISSILMDEIKEWDSIPGIQYEGITESPQLELQKADCVVLPSYREGMPRSLLEAGAMGMPSVATNVPGCRHIIKHNFNGILCEPKNIESLSQALKEMISTPMQEQRKMGQRARDIVVKSFSEQKLIDLTLDFVEKTRTNIDYK